MVAILLIAIWGEAFGAEPTFDLTLVDDTAHGFATFRSHNQKVAFGPYGLFTTHLGGNFTG